MLTPGAPLDADARCAARCRRPVRRSMLALDAGARCWRPVRRSMLAPGPCLVYRASMNTLNRLRSVRATQELAVRNWKCNAIRYLSSQKLAEKYDAVIVGAGHNGLVCGAYLARAGKRVCILERRHIVGGAAVTEEIVPDFKFSRASYVLGLLRPHIVKDLQLELYEVYETLLSKFADALIPLLDTPAPHMGSLAGASLMDKLRALPSLQPILKTGGLLGPDLPLFQELLTAPTSRILNHWFESEPLKATLATDSVIGAFISPNTPGSGYVLLHHVMAETGGVKGAWGNPEGGMGAVTGAMARSALASGVQIFTDMPVSGVLLNSSGCVEGVEVEDGSKVLADTVICNCTPHTALLGLLPPGVLPKNYEDSIRLTDYASPVCKINVALSRLPNFTADPNTGDNKAGPQHVGTIHLNCEDIGLIEAAYLQGQRGLVPDRPLIELTLPSSLDSTIAPPGCHVALFFTQYLPYTPSEGAWDKAAKDKFAKQVFCNVDEYAPGFSESVVGYEVLAPPDLEDIFGLRGGNIFHGAMSLDRLFWSRPSPLMPGPRTPVPGLLLCSAGSHPGEKQSPPSTRLLLGLLDYCWVHSTSAGLTRPLLGLLDLCWVHSTSAGFTRPLLGLLDLCWVHSTSAGFTRPLLGSLDLYWVHSTFSGFTRPLLGSLDLCWVHSTSTGFTRPLLGSLDLCWVQSH
ncbi:Amine oxidase [Trinorchestia longiramus]|nr:Amine oxidase [Trinorchestia longiramus]